MGRIALLVAAGGGIATLLGQGLIPALATGLVIAVCGVVVLVVAGNRRHDTRLTPLRPGRGLPLAHR